MKHTSSTTFQFVAALNSICNTDAHEQAVTHYFSYVILILTETRCVFFARG
jgi:hypothetical protein